MTSRQWSRATTATPPITHGHTLPAVTMDTLKTLDGWILGPIGHRAYPKDVCQVVYQRNSRTCQFTFT